MSEYKKRYHEDVRLNCSPDKYYENAWEGWSIFLGKKQSTKKIYLNLQEAEKATKSLGIKTSTEYFKRYKEDPKLPARPNKFYSNEWDGWPVFLGQKSRQINFYLTIKEASHAAQSLCLRTKKDYKNNYKKDDRLPYSPDKAYAAEWENWSTFLGQLDFMKNFYPSLQEATEAARSMGICTNTEYRSRYHEDPRLPSTPHQFYSDDWKGWPVFLGNEERINNFYPTLEDASKAAQALSITTSTEYFKRYTEDSRLPHSPDSVYSHEWKSWPVFLEQLDRVRDFYLTLEEASAAAQSLGITTMAEYNKRYTEDPRLPSMPTYRYAKKWESWPIFLGKLDRIKDFYPTLTEASVAARKLGFTNGREYSKGYSEDPRLPSMPRSFYPEEWKSWKKFLGVDRSSEPLNGAFSTFSETCPEWKAAVERHILGGLNQNAKITHLKPFLEKIVIPSGCVDWPGMLLHRDSVFPVSAFEAFVYDTGETLRKPRYNTCMYFLDWILDEYCSEENDNGEIERLAGYRNPIAALVPHLGEQFQPYRPSESTKPVLPMSVIERARKHLIPDHCKTFSDLSNLHDFLKDTWFEVPRDLIDESDPDCVWREVTKDRKRDGKRYREKVVELWSPVKTIALFTLLKTPLRGQQILWLDSGEADCKIPIIIGDEINWIDNLYPLGSYKRSQGFIKEFPDGFVGMSITTNKTGGNSYSVPYMPYGLPYWLIRLRDWQNKYNPLVEPTPWTKIDLRQKINIDILRSRGSQTFLFRDPCNSKGNKYSPIHTTTAFSRSLPALLFAIQRPNENLAEIDIVNGKSPQYKSKFTPHSLRTSLITALMIDGGASADTLMKLVGHATIVMTLYYAKVGPGAMFKELFEAEQRALEGEVDRLKDLAFTNKIEEAKSKLIATDSDFFSQLDASWPSAAYQFMDFGLCPMSGQGCDQGGSAVVNRKTETIYAPVEFGYLGKRNCFRCRFFVTGPAWIGGIKSLANQILLEINAVKREYHELLEKQRLIEDEKFDTESIGKQFTNMKTLNQTTAAMEERGQKLDVFLTDFQHLFRYLRQCIVLLNKDTDSTEDFKQQLVVNRDGFMQMILEESSSEFRLLASVCKDADIYESASASRATPKLAQLIDIFADNNGFKPGMFKLSEKQQLKAVNQITNLLLSRFNGDWLLTENLVKGDLTLADLGTDDTLIPFKSDIANALRGDFNPKDSLRGKDV